MENTKSDQIHLKESSLLNPKMRDNNLILLVYPVNYQLPFQHVL